MTISQDRGPNEQNTGSPAYSPRILIVDDAKENVVILSGLVKKFGQVSFALDGETALRNAGQVPPDLILLDIEMPGMDGLEVLRRLRAHETLHSVPVIFVTGRSDINSEEAGLKLGANDYITKPFNPTVVDVRVKNQLMLRRISWELEQANQKLENLANTDYLTGASNRRHFLNLLDAEMLRYRRYNRDATVMVLHLDHNINANNSHDYNFRDEVLVKTYNSVKQVLRVQDKIGRIGSDEFALLIPETNLEGANALADRILTDVRNALLDPRDGVSCCAIRIGIAPLNRETQSGIEVLNQAGNAL